MTPAEVEFEVKLQDTLNNYRKKFSLLKPTHSVFTHKDNKMEGADEAEIYNEHSAFLNLPEIVVEQIIGYLSFDEIAQKRNVCRRFNQINKRLLNKGFRRVEKYQAKFLKEVKSQLPRRESERRNHPLFRHCDILTAIETRLSLLNMTFTKYVDCSMCCFIPGKVIDEIYRVLQFISNNRTLPRSHELLTELRDISSMAMEHFEEKIVHLLKPNPSMTPTTPRFSLATSHFSSPLSSIASPGSSGSIGSPKSLSSPTTPSSLDQLSDLKTATKTNKNLINSLKKECHELRSKQTDLKRKVSEQERVVLEQSRIISEQTTKLTSQENKMNEINRKFLEYDQRFGDLMAELAHHSREDGTNSTSGTSGGSVLRYHSVQQPLFVANMMPMAVPTYVSATPTHSYTAASPLAFSVATSMAPTAIPLPHGSSIVVPQSSKSSNKDYRKEKESNVEKCTNNENNRIEALNEFHTKNRKDLHKKHKRHYDDLNMDGGPNKIRKK